MKKIISPFFGLYTYITNYWLIYIDVDILSSREMRKWKEERLCKEKELERFIRILKLDFISESKKAKKIEIFNANINIYVAYLQFLCAKLKRKSIGY